MVLIYGLINTIARRGNKNFRHFEENLKPKDEDEDNTWIQMKGDYRRRKTSRRGTRQQMLRKKISECEGQERNSTIYRQWNLAYEMT